MQSTHPITQMIAFRGVKGDGSVEDITENDLYRYTRHRWIYDEAYNLLKRYHGFDLQGLLQAAVAVVSSQGARRCIEVLKCLEGLNNRVFLLTMDNGSEVIAKLPFPFAGPAFYTTASEVATREFLRDILGIPIPRVLAWSSDSNNPVGVEYILEEKAPGKSLARLWQDWKEWPLEARSTIIKQIVKVENRLASTKFAKSGCIYFRNDFPGGDYLVTSPPQFASTLQRFTLGPIVESGMWRGPEGMDMNRGPYREPMDFVKAMAECEIISIKEHARPRMNYALSLTDPELPEDMLDLLDRYLQLAPAMVPALTLDDTHSPTLWHPDLYLDNIFVNPISKKITGIIDWQATTALPLFYQCGIPRMLRHHAPMYETMTEWRKHLEIYDRVGQSEKEKEENIQRSKYLHQIYLAITCKKNPRHFDALRLHDKKRTQPIRIVQSVWKDCDVVFLRRALISITKRWSELCPRSGPCPVSFTEQEVALCDYEAEHREFVRQVLRDFQWAWGLSPNGAVDPARFDAFRVELAKIKDALIAAPEDEADKLLVDKLWPWQDVSIE